MGRFLYLSSGIPEPGCLSCGMDPWQEHINRVARWCMDHQMSIEVHRSDSGDCMIDVKGEYDMWVFQFTEKYLGLSLVNEENPGFGTVPDQTFPDFESLWACFLREERL